MSAGIPEPRRGRGTAGEGGAPPAPSRRSRWARWGPPLAILPFLALLAFGLTRDARQIPSPLPGEAAPDFALQTLHGDTVSLSSLRGRVVVLNFWASWCLPCRDEHPVLLRTVETYPASEVAVVGVVYQDAPENARRFMAHWGGDWESGLDPGSRTAIDFGVYGVPETFFIGRDSRVARKHIGPVSWELVRGTVDSLLAAGGPGAPAAVLETPAPATAGAPAEEAGG